MTSSLSLWRTFLGPRILTLLGIGIATGIGLFGVEFLFAYLLQSFLAVLGIADLRTLQVPSFLAHRETPWILYAILILSIARGGLFWLQEFSSGMIYESFRTLLRKRVVTAVFSRFPMSSDQVQTYFSEYASSGANALLILQSLLTRVTICALLILALLRISPALTAISLIGGALLFPLLRTLNRTIGTNSTQIHNEWEQLSRRISLALRNLLLIRIYGMEASELQFASDRLDRYLERSDHFYKTLGLTFSLPQIAGAALLCAITAIAKHSFELSPGVLLTYFYILFRLSQNASLASQSWSNFKHFGVLLSATQLWWSSTQTHTAPKLAALHQTSIKDAHGIGWSIENLTFRYGKEQPEIFKNFSLNLAPGKSLGIIGPSGAGKSTLLALLLGQADPTNGTIHLQITGQSPTPLAAIKDSLLDHLGYVGPECFLIEGSLLENLCFGLKNRPSQEKIESALKLAHCDFVGSFSDGLNHRLTEQGEGLSAGQKQRLALARALLREPKVLIFDEATANLDNATEEKLIETLASLKSQMSFVIVTHREKPLELVDQIVRL